METICSQKWYHYHHYNLAEDRQTTEDASTILAATVSSAGRKVICCCLAVSKHQTVQAFESSRPSLGQGGFVAPSASLIGKVSLGRGSSVWYNAVLRGEDPLSIPCSAAKRWLDYRMIAATFAWSGCSISEQCFSWCFAAIRGDGRVWEGPSTELRAPVDPLASLPKIP